MPVVVNNSDSSGGGAADGSGNITINAVVAELQQTNESIKNIADVIGKDTVKTNLILPFIDAFTSVFASSLSAMSTPAVSAPAGGDIAAAKAANLQEWFFFGVISNLESINLKLTDILSNLSSSKGSAAAGKVSGGGGGIGAVIAGIGEGLGALGEGLSKIGNPKAALGAGILVLAGSLGVFLIGKAIQEGGWENISLATAGTVALAIAGIGLGLGIAAKGVKSFGAAAGVALAFLAMCPALLLLGPAIIEGGWASIPLIAIASASAAIIGLGLGIAIASKGIKDVSQGLGLAAAFIAMGPALALMGIGLQLGGWDSISLEAILKGAAAIVAFGGALWLVSKTLKPSDAIKGAIAVGAMSAGLAVFGLAMGIVNDVISKVTIETMVKLGVLIGGLGLAFGIAGGFIGQIALGSLAFAAIGAGLLIFSIGLLPLAIISELATPETIIKMFTLVAGLGAVFALAGMLIVPIALGAGAFALMGGALLAFGLALGVCNWEKILTPKMVKYVPAKIGEFLQNLGNAFKKISFRQLGNLVLTAPAMIAVGIGLKAMGDGLQSLNNASFNSGEANKIKDCLQSMVNFCAEFGNNENIKKIELFANALKAFGIDAIQGIRNMSTLTEAELSNINYDGIKILYNKLKDVFVGENDDSAKSIFSTLAWETQKMAEQNIIKGAFGMIPSMIEAINQLNIFGSDNLINEAAIDKGLATVQRVTAKVMNLGVSKTEETTKKKGGWFSSDSETTTKFKSNVEMAATSMQPFMDFANSIENGTIDKIEKFAKSIFLLCNPINWVGFSMIKQVLTKDTLNKLEKLVNIFADTPNMNVKMEIATTAKQEVQVSFESELKTEMITGINYLKQSIEQSINSQNRILQEIVVASREQKIATSVPTIITDKDYLNA